MKPGLGAWHIISILAIITVGANGFGMSKVFASTTYVVQSGDTLYSIGIKFGVSWQSIASANNIVSPYTIYPGEVLVIPTSSTTSSSTAGGIATGVSTYDQYDSYILASSQSYGIADTMMVKSMIIQESAFVSTAVSQDTPCAIPSGWTSYQSRSFGLMQVTPACVQPSKVPNLTTNQHSTKWATSWFNPQYNVDQGTKILSSALADMKGKFPGCTTNQYMLMVVGAYNSGEGAIFGCGSWDSRAGTYITAVLGHYQTFAQMAGVPYPY